MRHHYGFCGAAVWLLLGIGTFPLAQTASSPQVEVRELKTCRVNGHTPVIDGNLSEPAWDTCMIPRSDGFTQREPDEGKPATESTKVAVMYDNSALYVAFWCYDSEPDKIRAELVRRDRWSESDYVEFQVDPFHDLQTGYEFTVTAAGVLADARFYNDNNSDPTWDGVWEADVQHQPWGYSVEMKIPYHCLRFTEQDSQTWGVNFTRGIIRKNEFAKWNFSPQSDAGFVSRFGHLTGLDGLQPTGHTQVMPYAVSSLETEPKSVGNPDGRAVSGNTGVDVKLPLSTDLVVDATINPDFGQVELDQPVLNLSAYETFYEEKRPFFMEGANLFTTRYNLFYSRRLGRPPRYNVNDPEFGYYKDFPQSTTILGAGRITGKIADRTTIAFLTAVTQREKAEYAALFNWQPETTLVDNSPAIDTVVNWVPRDTAVRKGVVEPQASYSVLRVKQDILRNSFVGGMLTLASQQTVHPSVCGGVDWRLTTNNRMWAFRGQTLFSRNDPVRTGYGVDAVFEKMGGKHTRGSFSVRFNSPYLNLNRLGYQTRRGSQAYTAWFQYRTTDDWWIIRNTYNNINFNSNWNYDGVNYSLGGNINTNIEFKNGWFMWASLNLQAEKYSDEETRGNGLWVWPEYPTVAFFSNFNTDGRKPVSFWWGIRGGADRGGDWWGADLGSTVKPKSNVECNLWVTREQYLNSYRWLANVYDASYGRRMPVFGVLDWNRFSFGVGVNYLFRRNLSVQVSAEGLINGLDYSNYRYYVGENQYGAQLAGWNTDYNYSALNTMMLVRWEYMPGSTLYLVWTRARDEFDDRVSNLDYSRDFKRLFSAGSTNIFLVKMSYWINI